MDVAIFIGLGVIGLVALVAVISPSMLYWVGSAWQYRNAEANEPSGAAYGITRFLGVLGIGGVIAAGVMMATGSARETEQISLAEQCRTEWEPALEAIFDRESATEAEMQRFADEHDLDLQVFPLSGSVPQDFSYMFSSGETLVLTASTGETGQVKCAVE